MSENVKIQEFSTISKKKLKKALTSGKPLYVQFYKHQKKNLIALLH
jgi:hypothetical protein